MALSTHITTALNSALAYGEAIELARKDAKGMTRDAVRDVILPIVASKFAVALKDGEGKAKGAKVLDKDAPKYEAAKKAAQRLLKPRRSWRSLLRSTRVLDHWHRKQLLLHLLNNHRDICPRSSPRLRE